MSTAVTMTPAVAEKLAAYQQATDKARAELMALISTQTGADAAAPADPAPVDPPAPAKRKARPKRKAETAETVASAPAAPKPTGPVLVQPKPKAPKAPAAPKAAPAVKPLTLEVRPWTSNDGQPWVTVALAGRRKGQSFPAKDKAVAKAWIDAIVRDADALKALLDTACGG